MESASQPTCAVLADRRVIFVGKLAGRTRRDAKQLVRQHGGVVCDRLDEGVDLIVVGDEGLPLDEQGKLDGALVELTADAGAAARPEVIGEAELWERLGLIETQQHVRRLYTPAMLAGLLGLPVAVIRRWQRRGLIAPVREVRRLPYFDFQEVTRARRLAELVAAGVSPQSIERQLAALARLLPSADRPLAQLLVIVEGKNLLLRQGDGLIDAGGQRRFDFEASPPAHEGTAETVASATVPHDRLPLPQSPEELLRLAGELEDAGRLDEAVAAYRAALAAGGADAIVNFFLAELLYRLGDVAGARERYYMAIELDEDFVEARASLGCVLAETGQPELAIAAFEGTLALHPEYADVCYHLARTLDELGRPREAEPRWQQFLELAPDSPWADEARQRLGEPPLDRTASVDG